MFAFRKWVTVIGISGVVGFISEYFARGFRESTDTCILQKS